MKSFSILRTNVGLTTNVKIMIGSNYSLSLNSIDSNYILSSSKFKKYSFNENNYYDEILARYYKNLPSEISFDIKYREDVENMSDNFEHQYDDLYNYGARNILDNKNYDEEYEYFAPLYLMDKIPSNFIIFRVDGSGIGSINNDNFKDEIINKLKIVKNYDLTTNSSIGQWLDKNFISNEYFPDTPLEIDFRSIEFSKWNGINLISGGYTSKSMFMDEIFESEREIFELEKQIFDGWRNNSLVFPNILNLSFLFDDSPSNPDIKRKWSINRYFGFYVNSMELVKTMSPYLTPKLNYDVVILEGNLLYSESNESNPFLENWTDEYPFYVEWSGEYYLVKRYSETTGEEISQIEEPDYINEEYNVITSYNYKIISDVNLAGLESELNKNYGYIGDNNILFTTDGNYFNIEEFDNADVWLIEIDGVYHNIIKSNADILKLNTDYSFEFKENYFTYKVASNIKTVSFLVDNNNYPKKFNIYKVNFTDIKDFDTRIVDTQYSRFEYELKDDITNTDEPKMYLDDFSSGTDPLEVDSFIYKNDDVNIPTSSEYTANCETFKIENGELSDIWRINPIYCRFGLQNSLCFQDYPYLLNNSLLFENFNKCADVYESNPVRSSRNLDYFYSLNSESNSYINHSLHIEKLDVSGEIDLNFKFDFDSYIGLNYNYDYFTYFFDSHFFFDKSNIKKNIKKHSYFNRGNSSVPNSTVFKGIEFKIYDVESIKFNNSGQLETINTSNNNRFDNYKFSILLTSESNNMSWEIIDPWQMDTQYDLGKIVVFDDILYISKSNTIYSEPTINIGGVNLKYAPYCDNLNWEVYENSILWTPGFDYSIGSNNIVYNNGNYYYYVNGGQDDFWNPIYGVNTGYNHGDVVLYKDNYYMSMTNSNVYTPNTDVKKTNYNEFVSIENDYKYWSLTQSLSPKWQKIEVWNPGKQYPNPGHLVYHNDTVYISNGESDYIEIGDEPGISIFWNRVYSLEADTDYVYKSDDNPIVFINNRYYLIKENPDNSTLDNGINVYINKKWKNVLINIYVNDNTLPNLSNSNRDDIYTDIHKNLTAYNFIRCINDISNKYGFVNYLNYIIIDENGYVNNYNYESNLSSVPHIFSCDVPQKFLIKKDSLLKRFINYKVNPNIYLFDKKIDKLSMLNWYNKGPVAFTISENNNLSNEYNSLEYLELYRFNGYYMPIFVDIDLFNKDIENKLEGNYLFDTNLTNFGIIKERKIRKVNRFGSILKFRNSRVDNSIFPMVDEYGYTFLDFMIFKSNWDFEYHIETVESKERFITKKEPISKYDKQIGQPIETKLDNDKKYKL